jgi:hypothetical protein
MDMGWNGPGTNYSIPKKPCLIKWCTLCPSWEQETAMTIPHVLGVIVFIFQSGGVECMGLGFSSSKLSSHFHAAKGDFWFP